MATFLSVSRLLYPYVADADKAAFLGTCRQFRDAAIQGEIAKKVCSYIQEKYNLKIIGSFSTLDPISFLKVRAFLIGEYHMSDLHRKVNSSFVDLIFNPSVHEIYCEVASNEQIPYSKRNVKSCIKVWDTDKKWIAPVKGSLFFLCAINAAFFKSSNFPNIYVQYKKVLHDYMKGECKDTPIPSFASKTNFQISKNVSRKEVIQLLLNETENTINYSRMMMDLNNQKRNEAFCEAVMKSYGLRNVPIVLAGASHPESEHVQKNLKEKRLNALVLVPKLPALAKDAVGNSCQDSQDAKILKAAEADPGIFKDLWELEKKIQENPKEMKAIILKNVETILKIKMMFLNEKLDQKKPFHHFYLLAMASKYCLLHELYKLEK